MSRLHQPTRASRDRRRRAAPPPNAGRKGLVVAALTVALALVSSAVAQSLLFGGGVAFVDLLPLPSVQFGGEVASDVELRMTLDALPPMFFDAGADVLYLIPAAAGGRTWYVGGGPGVLLLTMPVAAAVVTVHATGGVELPIDDHTSFYVELDPGVDVGLRGPVISLRAGVDWRF